MSSALPNLLTAPEARLRYYLVHFQAAVFPVSAGLLLYGWRAGLTLVVVFFSTALAVALWRGIGRRGPALHYAHALWLAVLLGMMLPPHLASGREPWLLTPVRVGWALLPAAGLLLAFLAWCVGSDRPTRAHPLLLSYLVLALLFSDVLAPHVALHRTRLIVGDVIEFPSPAPTSTTVPGDLAWIDSRDLPTHDALYFDRAAAARLSQYTRVLHREWASIESLLRDAMPPLEDLVIGGHPGPIGASSAIALLVGGLFLLYRSVIRARIPLLTVLSAYAGFLLLPIPIVITDAGAKWLPITLPRANLDWPTIVTFANYQLLASPLLLVAFFIAPSPTLCPTGRAAQVMYALALGTLTAACQLYLSCAAGAYLALLLAALLGHWLEERLGGVNAH